MTTGRALEAALDALHGLVCEALTDELRRAIQMAESPPEGIDPVPINPQLIDKVLKFLAQNGVNAPASSPKVDGLARELADLDLDDQGAFGRPN